MIAVPATRITRGLAIEVSLGPEDGVPAECVPSFDDVDLVARVHFCQRSTRLNPERTRQACKALALAVGCE